MPDLPPDWVRASDAVERPPNQTADHASYRTRDDGVPPRVESDREHPVRIQAPTLKSTTASSSPDPVKQSGAVRGWWNPSRRAEQRGAVPGRLEPRGGGE